ncbi:MAG TPA: HAD family hydrolase [Usitatibacter sp.]|nr:HAD family hydrolase [Usitatibacter sp.]
MRYTAVALDFDGTIAHDSEVPAHVIDGLRRLKDTGRKLLLVTGRELPELLDIFKPIEIFDRVVAENGALLYRPSTGERVELGEPPPQELIDLLRERGVPISVGASIVATVEPHETVVLQTIRELGLERPVIFNKGAVMILPPGINKATGLKHALAELGLSARNLVAGGDAENDHALLEAAEYSVAVANAITTLKQSADRVTNLPRGDGILEVIDDLIANDLAKTPPKRERRALRIGKDANGSDVTVKPAGVSMLVTGAHGSGKSSFTRRVLERLSSAGYQFCVLDGRGEYLDFRPAVVFGTQDNAPDPFEILTALEKPDVQAVVCLAAVLPAKRAAFFEKLKLELLGLREKTGRPHWLVIDEAQELVPRARDAIGDAAPLAENSIYVTTDPAAIDERVIAAVDVVAVRGAAARQSLESLAAILPDDRPAEPLRAPAESEALIWFRNTGRAPQLVTLPPRTHSDRALRNDVGRLLRRA